MAKPIIELKDEMSSWSKVVIIPHVRPDGDAMGSSLALYHYFKNRGIMARVVAPTYYPFFLHWLPGNNDVWQFFQFQPQTTSSIKNADAVFCLDFNDLSRIDKMGQLVENHAKLVVNIDHHLEPKMQADYILRDTKASSTCELVYRFIDQMGDVDSINKDIATCLYTGIYTDTGGFRHSNTGIETHKITADLMQRGVNITEVHSKILENSSLNRLRFLGHSLLNKLKVYPFLNAALIIVSKEDAVKFELEGGDTEGLVNYPLSIKGIKLAVLMKEEKEMIKISFRSKNNFPANEMAKNYFEGGGHAQAAGGRSLEPLDKTIAKFEKVLQKYKEQLQG